MPRVIFLNRFSPPTARDILHTTHAAATLPEVEIDREVTPDDKDLEFLGAEYEGRFRKDYERGLSYVHEMAERRKLVNQVFLGGSCDPTTWRKDIAIPALEEAGCRYYDPQVDDWYPELMEIEAKAKLESYVLIFVFDDQTRAIASINEAVEFMTSGAQRVVIAMKMVQPGLEIAGQTLTVEQAMDINMARAELMGLAKGYGVPVFEGDDAIERAVTCVVNLLQDAETDIQVGTG